MPGASPVAFFHIPKAGGTTVENALAWYAVTNGLTYSAAVKWAEGPCPTRRCQLDADVVFGHMVGNATNVHRHGAPHGGSERLRTFRTLRTGGRRQRATMLRHPLELVISSLFHFGLPGLPRADARAPALEWSRVQSVLRAGHNRRRPNSQSQWEMLFGDAAPRELNASAHRCVQAAGELLRENFDLVGTTERFDETMLVWTRQLNASAPLHYIKANAKSSTVAQRHVRSAQVRSAANLL